MEHESASIGSSPLQQESEDRPRPRRGILRGAAAVCQLLGLAAVLLGCVGLWAYLQTGRVAAILPYLGGQRIFIDPLEVSFGRQPPGALLDLGVTLSNRSGQPVRALGSQVECTCMATDDFPLSVEAGQDRRLTLKLRLPKQEGPFEKHVTYFVDQSGSQFLVHVVGHVAR